MFVIVETFRNPGEPSSSEIRVRPVAGQGISTEMRVQCSRAMRGTAPVGSRFRLFCELVHPENNSPFLRHKASDPWELVDE
jgi:hypothetical protein